MTAWTARFSRSDGHFDGEHDKFIYRVAAYGVPALFLLLSVLALGWGRPVQEPVSAKPLNFQVVQQLPGESSWTLESAKARLGAAAENGRWDSHLRPEPVWLRAVLPAAEGFAVFPSRHAQALSCWGEDGHFFGRADRTGTAQPWRELRGGFALQLADSGVASRSVVCRAELAGPARLSLEWMSAADVQRAASEFQREIGWIDGGLLVLALFLFVTALINRNGVGFLFSSWILLNLRMASVSAGWDVQWLGHRVPAEWLVPSRLATVALYHWVTYALFRNFFREELRRVGHPVLLRGAALTCLPVLLLSLVLPAERFLPIVWVVSGIGVLALLFFMGRILWLARSRVALWYAASMAATLLASMAEVLGAALGLKGLTGVVNSGTAAVSSSLLAALAVAAQMKRERDRRREAQAKLQATFEAMPVGLFTLGTDGRVLRANASLRRMLAREGDALPTWPELFGLTPWANLQQALRDDPQRGEFEFDVPGSAGVARRFRVHASLAAGRIEGTLLDVTEQMHATDRLQFLAQNDPLTRVLNRRGLESAFNAWRESAPAGQRLAVAYLDLDRFKLINDLYGHAAGDEVLQQVCQRAAAMLADPMRLGRVGGDEFVVLLPGTSLDLACLIGRGLLASLGGSPYRVGDRAFQVRGSLGLIEVDATQTFKDAMATADHACREAKKGMGDGLVVFEPGDSFFKELEAEMALVGQLTAHGMVDGLFVEMQPIMSLRTPRASLNFEVLLRMHDTAGKRVPTQRLINAAEHSGRMGTIDRWVMRHVLTWLRDNRAALQNTQFVCMNLSGASLNDEQFVDDACEMLESYMDVAPLLCLEVTESVALHDLDNTRRFIHQVRQYGVKVALDDFGAGYTSFSYLKELPGDLLKVDGSFIRTMNQHPANIAIVEAIVSLARNLGMKTIAEWAEDLDTVETLAEIGVDYVQGFAVARPQNPLLLVQHPSSASFENGSEFEACIDRLEREGATPELVVGSRMLRANAG